MRLRTMCPDRDRRRARRGDRRRTRQRPGQEEGAQDWAGCRTPRRSTRSSRQDEENFRIWALNWDLLVNFSPDDLSPAPGIAKSWEVSKDKKTVTFHLIEGAKWSDGEPITSKDVKYSLDVLGTDGLIFTGYTSQRHHDRDARRPDRSWSTPSQPDARIIGGLFVYIIPEHVYGKDAAQGAAPALPADAAAGRQRALHRHRVRARPDRDDGAQPELPRQEAGLRRDPVHQVRDRSTPSSGRCSSARST